ncbi:MAG: DUF1697 domain-containing protein [Actinobacteria bacterium]|nr:MAG: DUF1697 domain-containing protein [Actinomycetota bacterium]
MTPAVALLRAVNVGGRAVLAMDDLRRIAAAIGLDGPRTYLQSGNLVFAVAGADAAGVAPRLEGAIATELGVETTVIVRSRAELAAVAAAHPFSTGGIDPRLLHVVFLTGRPQPDRVAALDPDRSPPDAFLVDGSHVYVAYPNGSGRSKLNLDYFERRLGVAGTARNWNTVGNLLAMMG